MSTISTEKILKAINYYSLKGYKIIDVPMCVDIDVSCHTKPEKIKDIYHSEEKVYVASAEQSFIQLHKDGVIGEGSYMALTPCCRPNETLSDTHYNVFLKLELITIGSERSYEMAKEAQYFFMSSGVHNEIKKTDEAKDSVDLISINGGVELGSYGVRKMIDGKIYTYGTGIAEPRLSMAK